MKSKILEYYKKQIDEFEKIKFEDAKNILKECIDKDDVVKKDTFDKVFKCLLCFRHCTGHGGCSLNKTDTHLVLMELTMWHHFSQQFWLTSFP